MNVTITLTFAFRSPTADERKLDRETNSEVLPRFADLNDFHYLAWQDSGLPLYLRQLAAHLPDNRRVSGSTILKRYPAPTTKPTATPDFLSRITKVRLKKIFFGDAPHPNFSISHLTFHRIGSTLTCRYSDRPKDSNSTAELSPVAA